MTNEQLAAMHRLLAEYHRNLAKEAVLDIVQQYHADVAQRLADEAAQIPRRTAILERLHSVIYCKLGKHEYRPPVCDAFEGWFDMRSRRSASTRNQS
jgi:hypothetical protein